MGIEFTADQKKVIDLHHRNILVSAAAGSGKTAVLVERIIRMICDEANPVDIDRLLIVTFTNAAAAEMRERISLGIAAMQEKLPESEHIERQAALLHNAQITTIDSFCLYLIRNHFHEIGLDPAFRVADEGEIKLLKQDVLGEMLEAFFAEKEEGFLECVEFFCTKGKEKPLEDLILNLHKYAGSNPWPREWLEACREGYNVENVEELEASPLGQYVKEYLVKMLRGGIQTMERAGRLCEEPDGPYMYGELIDAELEQMEKIAGYQSLREWEVGLETLTFKTLSSKKDTSVNSDKRELAKKLRSSAKDIVKNMKEQFFGTLLETSMEQIKQCKKPVNVLLDLTLEFDRLLQEKKRERKLLDFSDMEHYALEILLERDGKEVRPSKVAKEYREYFHEILIDEYQDSNLVQEYLLLAISGEEEQRYNRFMVGDVKQSIYKFRLARPELFMEKYKSYRSEESQCQRIDLSQNFRSRDSVVKTVNSVFQKLMSEEVGGIAYDEHAALHVGAVYPENSDSISELLLLDLSGEENSLDEKEAEGSLLAAKIKELKEGYLVTDKETGMLRPVQYKDMVILLRATSGWDEVFKKILEQEGIPVYITSKTGYFGASEVQELLQLLRVLDNPGQDIPLFGTMKSVFGGFDEEEIALLRSQNKKISLWELVCAQAETGNGKCQRFVKMVAKYRSFAVFMPIRELLQTIVEEFSYLDYVSALPGGGKRKANVEMLFVKASAFEKTSYFGLFHFIRYMEQLEKYEVDYGQEDMLDESADVVRIMSIHKSKGLEFPVTFVAGLGKKFNMMDVNKSFLMDMDLGVGTDYINTKERYRTKGFRRMGLMVKLKEETLAEELRVLYVALTRAKEKLIMTAILNKAEEKWNAREMIVGGQIGFGRFMGAGTFMDFLLPVLEEENCRIRIYTGADLQMAGVREQLQLLQKQQVLENVTTYRDEDSFAKLQEAFGYTYAYENLQKLYTKTTVSELKIAAMADKDEAAYHQFEEREVEPILPAFLKKEEGITATTRGNAYHKVMELLDFQVFFGGKEREGIALDAVQDVLPVGVLEGNTLQVGMLTEEMEKILRENLQALVEKRGLPREYYEALNLQKLLIFLQDPIAKRMWQAQKNGQLYREQPFVLGISATKLSEEFPPEEKVLIQGIIDAFFVEDGEIVLLDYKTDKVKSSRELWDRYETQLDYYKEALEKLMQMPVKECILYSFGLGRCVFGAPSE